MDNPLLLIGIVFGGGLVGLLVLFALIKSLWHVAEPNEALIVSGTKQNDELGFKIVSGHGTWVMPWQVVRTLDLSLHEAQLNVDCKTQQAISVGIKGVCIYKVGDDSASIANAARRFLDVNPDDMSQNIQQLADGHLRSIIGSMTMEDLIRGRDKLMSETRDAMGVEMAKLGLIIDSLQIKDISDPSGYIDSMAAPHVAEVKKTARIAQAQADQDATQAEQTAQANMASYTRDTQTKKAEYQAEVDQATAKASQAGPLSEALARQDVVRAATETASLEAQQKEQQLQVDVRKPADAEAYAVKTRAEGARDAAIAQATAEAQATRLRAEADAAAATVTGTADGAAAKARGEGEAAGEKAKLLAQADGISARAKALAENQDAVISQTIAERLPEIVKETAGAFSHVDNLNIVNGADGVGDVFGGILKMAMGVLPLLKSNLASNGETHAEAKALTTAGK